MIRETTCHSALLRRDNLLRIDAIPGQHVACVRGMVWLTQEHDAVDRVLSAGESFVFDRPGVALANALAQDAVLEYPAGLGIHFARGPAAPLKRAASLASEIGRIRSRVDPHALRALPSGARREALERDVRRMRRQVDWLVMQHARLALVQAVSGLVVTPLNALWRCGREVLRKMRRVSAH